MGGLSLSSSAGVRQRNPLLRTLNKVIEVHPLSVALALALRLVRGGRCRRRRCRRRGRARCLHQVHRLAGVGMHYRIKGGRLSAPSTSARCLHQIHRLAGDGMHAHRVILQDILHRCVDVAFGPDLCRSQETSFRHLASSPECGGQVEPKCYIKLSLI